MDIRPARDKDTIAISLIYGEIVEGTSISFEEEAPGREEIARRMASRPRLPWLVAESGTGVIGYAYASHHRERSAYRWSANCSVYLARAHRGRGFGRLLYERLISEMGSLGYVSLLAGIALPNAASIGLHEALGFQRVGVFPSVGFKHGAWHDVGWWFLPLVPAPPVDPGEPREWSTTG